MRRHRFAVVVFIALLGTVWGSTLSTVAQESTPGAGPTGCDGPQRSADELVDLWFGISLAPDGTPGADEEVDGVVIPTGKPADDATAAAVEATIRAAYACLNGGDLLRASALFTDELASQVGPEPGISREEAAANLAAPPHPASASETVEIVAVTDVMQIDSRRIGAFLVEQIGGKFHTSYAIFREFQGAWLVDEIIEFTPDGQEAPGVGTATAG
jgi:hypothetical protein